jgi:hypothetical protein
MGRREEDERWWCGENWRGEELLLHALGWIGVSCIETLQGRAQLQGPQKRSPLRLST